MRGRFLISGGRFSGPPGGSVTGSLLRGTNQSESFWGGREKEQRAVSHQPRLIPHSDPEERIHLPAGNLRAQPHPTCKGKVCTQHIVGAQWIPTEGNRSPGGSQLPSPPPLSQQTISSFAAAVVPASGRMSPWQGPLELALVWAARLRSQWHPRT